MLAAQRRAWSIWFCVAAADAMPAPQAVVRHDSPRPCNRYGGDAVRDAFRGRPGGRVSRRPSTPRLQRGCSCETGLGQKTLAQSSAGLCPAGCGARRPGGGRRRPARRQALTPITPSRGGPLKPPASRARAARAAFGLGPRPRVLVLAAGKRCTCLAARRVAVAVAGWGVALRAAAGLRDASFSARSRLCQGRGRLVVPGLLFVMQANGFSRC